MHRNPVLYASILTLLLVAGCLGGTSTDTGAEPDAENIGVPATFTMDGSNLSITGELSLDATVAAPFTVEPGQMTFDDRNLLFIPNATVNEETGLLAITTDQLTVSNGEILVTSADKISFPQDTARFRVTPDERVDSDAVIPPSYDDMDSAYFHAEGITFPQTTLTLTDFDNAVLLHDNTSTTVSSPVTVSTTSLVFGANTGFTTDIATVDLETDRFSAGGDTTGGTATLHDENREISDVRAVFGRTGDLQITSTQIETAGDTRVTQVLTGDGPVIDAAVSMQPETSDVTVTQDDTAWVKVTYEETSRRGDALLENVTVTGTGADLVTVPLEKPPSHTQQYIDTVIELSEEMPLFIFGIVGAPAAVFVDALEAVVCALGECPSDHPLPLWIDAGSSDRFYYRVSGDTDPGTYNATIHVKGENYDTVTLPVTITVTENQ